MRTTLSAAVLAVVGIFGFPSGAGAIVAGELDGNAHPNVGLVVLEDQFGSFFCSGTLVAPRLVLTAGHCVLNTTSAAVTFDSVAPPPPGGPGSEGRYVTGAGHAHPGFGMRNGHGFNDIGVVVLDAAVTGIAPAPLATAGMLTAQWTNHSLRRATVTL